MAAGGLDPRPCGLGDRRSSRMSYAAKGARNVAAAGSRVKDATRPQMRPLQVRPVAAYAGRVDATTRGASGAFSTAAIPSPKGPRLAGPMWDAPTARARAAKRGES